MDDSASIGPRCNGNSGCFDDIKEKYLRLVTSRGGSVTWQPKYFSRCCSLQLDLQTGDAHITKTKSSKEIDTFLQKHRQCQWFLADVYG